MVSSPDEGLDKSLIHGYSLRSRKHDSTTVINDWLANWLITLKNMSIFFMIKLLADMILSVMVHKNPEIYSMKHRKILVRNLLHF